MQASQVVVIEDEQPIRRGHLPRVRLANPGVAPMVVVTVVAVLLLVRIVEVARRRMIQSR